MPLLERVGSDKFDKCRCELEQTRSLFQIRRDHNKIIPTDFSTKPPVWIETEQKGGRTFLPSSPLF
jgi:hypothetical protein